MNARKVTYYHSKENEIEIIYCYNSNIEYPKHTHSKNYILGLVLDGALIINQKDCEKVCHQKEVFIITPNTMHSVRSIGEQGYSSLQICLSSELMYERDIVNISQQVEQMLRYLLSSNVLTIEQITIIIETIEFIYASVVGVVFPIDEEIIKTKRLIEMSPEEQLPIKQLSNEVFISPYYLIRQFKKQIGLTPHQYQIQVRIRKAQQLLREENNITKIALETGFCDQSHFDRCFTKMVGLTPSEYTASQKYIEKINSDKSV